MNEQPLSPSVFYGENPLVTFEGTDDEIFQNILVNHYRNFHLNSLSSLDDISQLLEKYISSTQVRFDKLRKGPKDSTLNNQNKNRGNPNESKAERDLWSLLKFLSLSDLTGDISENYSMENLSNALNELPLHASIPDFINTAYSADERLKKGFVLIEWLETAYLDNLYSIPVSKKAPWADTLFDILNSSKDKSGRVNSLHPDAQLTKAGKMLSLNYHDKMDQERILQVLWQLIRCGKFTEAQELAAEHDLYWLAASLRGVNSHYYVGNNQNIEQSSMDIDDSNSESISRVGNLKQPLWMTTCWKYSQNLFNCPDNWKLPNVNAVNDKDTNSTGILEMTIYAALCGNLEVLLESPLLVSWQDKLWAYMKTMHLRDLTTISLECRSRKAFRSAFYPGCDAATITAEKEFLALLNKATSRFQFSNCKDLFSKVPPPTSKNAESILYQLQAAFVEGYSGILYFCKENLPLILATKEHYPGKPSILRLTAHLLIWLRSVPSLGYQELVNDELFYQSIELYIDYLITSQQFNLVAIYSVYLNKRRRTRKYALVLLALQYQTKDVDEEREILSLADDYFPEDVLEISRLVVNEQSQLFSELTELWKTSGFNNSNIRQSSITFSADIIDKSFNESHISFEASMSASQSTPAKPIPTTPGIDGYAQGLFDTPFSQNTSFSLSSTPITPMIRSNRNSFKQRKATPYHNIRATPSSANSLTSGNRDTGEEYNYTDSLVAKPMELNDSSTLVLTPPVNINTTISNENIMKMESLKWLTKDPDHSHEALKQINRLIFDFLSHITNSNSSTSVSNSILLAIPNIKYLFNSYIPENLIKNGDELSRKHEEKVSDDLKQSKPEYAQYILNLVQAESLRWKSDNYKLNLWKQLLNAMEEYSTWDKQMREIKEKKMKTLGSTQIQVSILTQSVIRIQETTKNLLDSLFSLLNYNDNDVMGDIYGYNELWKTSKSASEKFIVALLQATEKELYQAKEIEKIQHEVDLPIIEKDLLLLFELLQNQLTSTNHLLSENMISDMSKYLDSNIQLFQLNQGYYTSQTILKLQQFLSESLSYFKDIQTERFFCRPFCSFICKLYLKVRFLFLIFILFNLLLLFV